MTMLTTSTEERRRASRLLPVHVAKQSRDWSEESPQEAQQNAGGGHQHSYHGARWHRGLALRRPNMKLPKNAHGGKVIFAKRGRRCGQQGRDLEVTPAFLSQKSHHGLLRVPVVTDRNTWTT